MYRTKANKSHEKEEVKPSWFRLLFTLRPWEMSTVVLQVYALIVILTLGGGIGLAFNENARETKELKQNLSQWVQTTATTLQTATLQRLKGDPTDEQLPEYQYLEKHLQAIRSLRHDEVRFVYLLGIRGGMPFFYGDSEPEHSADKSRPGDPFPELPPNAAMLFQQGEDTVMELYSDRWGKWLSAFVRLPGPSGSGTPVLLGIDLNYANTQAQILRATLRPLCQMAFVLVCLLFVGLAIAKLRKQTLSLESSERAFHDLAVNISDLLWETNTQMAFVYCSERVKEILGYEVDEVIGKRQIDFVIPEDKDRVSSFLKEAFAGLQPFRHLEFWVLSKEGTRVCLTSSGTPVIDPTGHFCGFRGVDSDITEKRKIEDSLVRRDFLLEAAAKAGDELLNGTDHIIASRNALRTLGVAIDADRAYLCSISQNSEEESHFVSLLCACDCTFMPGEMRVPNPPVLAGNILLSHWYDTLSSGLPFASHTNDLPEAEHALLSGRGVKSILLTPIMMHGSLWGVVFFEACTVSREWTLGEIMILLTSSSSIGTTLLRKQVEEKSKKGEAWLHALLETANDFAIIATTPDGVVSRYNSGAQNLLGYLPDDVIEKFPVLTFHVIPEVEEIGKTLVDPGKPQLNGFAIIVEGVRKHGVWKQEWTYVTKDGHRFRARTSIGEIRDDAGELHGYFAVIVPV